VPAAWRVPARGRCESTWPTSRRADRTRRTRPTRQRACVMRFRAVASRSPITRGTTHGAGGGGGGFAVVSRTKTSVKRFVSPETRFGAPDS
jgi:hypothetical protein